MPKNCEFLRVPLINSKLWNSESLQDSYRDNDKLMYKNQKLITKPILPIVQIMNSCLEKNDSVNNRLFDLASDGFSMMAYVHKDQSNIRLLKPAVFKPYHKLCNALAPVTENLFGDGLHEQIKDMNESRKVANNISHNKSSSKRRSTSSSNFGFKKPRTDYRSRNEMKQKSFLGSKARQYSKSSKTIGPKINSSTSDSKTTVGNSSPFPLVNQPNNFYAGKISSCYNNWMEISSDKWILDIDKMVIKLNLTRTLVTIYNQKRLHSVTGKRELFVMKKR